MTSRSKVLDATQNAPSFWDCSGERREWSGEGSDRRDGVYLRLARCRQHEARNLMG